MVLTTPELISSLKTEIRIFLHLCGKVDPAWHDYRPTPKQRSLLELVRYIAIMGPTQLPVIRQGRFDREAMSAAWGPAEAAAKLMSFDEAVAAIGRQAGFYELIGTWSEAELRGEVDLFGTKASRGSLLVNLALSAHAAYRMQLFLYLKACGREDLNTLNLWMGVDGQM